MRGVIGNEYIKKLHEKWSFFNVFDLANLISQPDSKRITDISYDDETDDDTEDSHLSETFYETDTHPPEYETNEKTSEMTIPNC